MYSTKKILFCALAAMAVAQLFASIDPMSGSPTPAQIFFTYSNEITGTPMNDAPNLLNTSYTISADVDIPQDGAEGMIVTGGGRLGGYGFYILKGKPVFLWNLLDQKRIRWEGADALNPGIHTLEFDFKYNGLGFVTLAFNNWTGIGQGGTGVLKVDGKVVATQRMRRTIPFVFQWDETFDIGADTGTPVHDRDYQVPFRFSGKLMKVTVKLEPRKLTDYEERVLREQDERTSDQVVVSQRRNQ